MHNYKRHPLMPGLKTHPILSAGLLIGTCIAATAAQGQWVVATLQTSPAAPPLQVARTTNAAGYTLELYKDNGDTIRSRFTLAEGLTQLAENSCPTFQIDNGKPRNRSIDDAPCIAQPLWAEFILGQVKDGRVASPILMSLMNGITITYRFMLANGDYRETRFSLTGSKWNMQSAFGQNVTVTSSP
jgi:hypothetical protein